VLNDFSRKSPLGACSQRRLEMWTNPQFFFSHPSSCQSQGVCEHDVTTDAVTFLRGFFVLLLPTLGLYVLLPCVLIVIGVVCTIRLGSGSLFVFFSRGVSCRGMFLCASHLGEIGVSHQLKFLRVACVVPEDLDRSPGYIIGVVCTICQRSGSL